jgi:hypothetical protein
VIVNKFGFGSSTMTQLLAWSVAVALLLAARPAQAQTPQDGDWKFAIYPVLAWIPTSIDIDVNVPPISGGGGSGPEFGGKIVDGRFDGAFFGGMTATNGTWKIEADGLWAAVGGDRAERPVLRVDVDAIYGHGAVGRRIYKDLYATVGIRRIALKYDIELAGVQFSRKPGLWDPLIGVAWQRLGKSLDLHANLEGGGFGVGADTDISTSFRLDWKPITHFGITAGYNFLYFKLSNTVLDRTFTAKQTMHGPVVGIGFYF